LARRESEISVKLTRRFRWRGVQLFDSIPTIMKHWAVLTVLLYALALLLLTVPVILIAFGNWGINNDNKGLHETLQIYSEWGYWLWLAIMVAGQALLLLLPINIAERRLPARRPLKVPIIVTAFFLTNLFLAGVFCVLCAIFTDGAFNLFDFLSLSTIFKAQSANGSSSGWGDVCGVILTFVGFWIIWTVVFWSFAKSDDPDVLLKRITRWLLRGSILELLVAVPSHVIVRRRDDCCAPAGTFWGIVTCISIMLLCFGPGVFFLFVERFQRLQLKSPDAGKQPAQK
jgi:hypothetical protein